MRLSAPLPIIAALFLPILTSHAFPLQAAQRERRQTPSYSVVPVDGGSTFAGTAPLTTVTQPASTRTQVSTFLSTIIITQIPTPTTIVVTITSPLTVLETRTATPSGFFDSSNDTASSFPTDIPVEIPGASPTAAPSFLVGPVEVLTVTAAPSSTPYDDGMWHTTYFHPVPTASAAAPTADVSGSGKFYPYGGPPYDNYTAPAPFNGTYNGPYNGTYGFNFTMPVNYTTDGMRR